MRLGFEARSTSETMASEWHGGISTNFATRPVRVTRKTAWFMLHRVREAFDSRDGGGGLSGPTEADGIRVGGLDRKRRVNGKPKPDKAVSENRASRPSRIPGRRPCGV